MRQAESRRIILNLLDITRSEQGQLRAVRVPVDLRALVGEVLEAHGPQAEAQGVTLRAIFAAPRLDADAELLRRVIENLVENAVRHAPRGSAVRVETAWREGFVEIQIADEGPGIPDGMRGAIFDRFVQLREGGGGSDGCTRGGRGLGLAFCKLAVEAHGGRIWVEDGRPGAVFLMRFPSAMDR